jgi:hypothetical protein
VKAATNTFKGRERLVKWQTIPHPDGTTIRFGDTGQVCVLEEETIASFADTGQPCFVRLKFDWSLVKSGVSKEHQFQFITWHGGAGAAYIREVGPRWLEALKLDKPANFHGCLHPYRVDLYAGPKALTNLKERFYFPGLPLEVASFKNEQVKLEWLAKNCVADLLERESKQLEAKAKQLEAEQLKGTPARLPHEDMDVDHYENWRQAMVKLLCKKWPNLCAAKKAFSPADTDQNKQKVLSAFIADYRTIFGELPDVKKEDAAELWKDDYYVGLMNKALNAGGSPVDEMLWQLAIGWLVKGYYRMNEKQLEEAFNRDWNYKPGQHKGNTLAKYARDKIGLLFALKRGRPEEHPFDDSALRLT